MAIKQLLNKLNNFYENQKCGRFDLAGKAQEVKMRIGAWRKIMTEEEASQSLTGRSYRNIFMTLSTTLMEHNKSKSKLKMQNSVSCNYKLNNQNACIRYWVYKLEKAENV